MTVDDSMEDFTNHASLIFTFFEQLFYNSNFPDQVFFSSWYLYKTLRLSCFLKAPAWGINNGILQCCSKCWQFETNFYVTKKNSYMNWVAFCGCLEKKFNVKSSHILQFNFY